MYSVLRTRFDTNQAVQPHKMANLKFRFKKLRYCSFYVSKTKALISCAVRMQLICIFVFGTYAKSGFSRDAACI